MLASLYQLFNLAVCQVEMGQVILQANPELQFSDGISDCLNVTVTHCTGKPFQPAISIGLSIDFHETVDGKATGFTMGHIQHCSQWIGTGMDGSGACQGECHTGGQ